MMMTVQCMMIDNSKELTKRENFYSNNIIENIDESGNDILSDKYPTKHQFENDSSFTREQQFTGVEEKMDYNLTI